VLDVGSTDLLAIGEVRRFVHKNRPFLLARIGDGSYHAVRSVCPHQGVDLSEGRLVGRNLPSEPGRHEHVADATVIRCPRHGYAYDVRDGCSRFDDRARIKAYKVTVEDQRVLVHI
jgi:nitrite reductase/ring-hydroxylating ferredoxin subunit